jgi:ribosomal protein S18 acetylase RimI-like enzyme
LAGYRFCRTDDAAALVRAWNACYRVHFPDLAPLTEETFRRLVRELDLWTSSCMLANEGDRPIGVLLACKRETESLIHTIGIHPDFQRSGHGRHMLASLASKLAILGPPRIVAEVPATEEAACEFLEACGYTKERTYTDLLLHKRPAPPQAADFIVEVEASELLDQSKLEPAPGVAWHRVPESIARRRTNLRGLALATDERIEAHLLYHAPQSRGPCEILVLRAAAPERRDTLLGLLIQTLAATCEGPVVLRRTTPDEVPFPLLEALGFRPAGRTHGYAKDARAEKS